LGNSQQQKLVYTMPFRRSHGLLLRICESQPVLISSKAATNSGIVMVSILSYRQSRQEVHVREGKTYCGPHSELDHSIINEIIDAQIHTKAFYRFSSHLVSLFLVSNRFRDWEPRQNGSFFVTECFTSTLKIILRASVNLRVFL